MWSVSPGHLHLAGHSRQPVVIPLLYFPAGQVALTTPSTHWYPTGQAKQDDAPAGEIPSGQSVHTEAPFLSLLNFPASQSRQFPTSSWAKSLVPSSAFHFPGRQAS